MAEYQDYGWSAALPLPRRAFHHTFSNELAIYLWGCVELRKDHHAFPNLFPSDAFESERGRLARRAHRDRYSLTFD